MDFEESIASIFAAGNHLPYLSLGNLIGNTIIAIAISFGIPILLLRPEIDEFPTMYYMLLVATGLIVLLSTILTTNLWILGLVLLFLFLFMVGFTLNYQRDYHAELVEREDELREFNLIQFFKIIIFIVLMIVGGDILVNNAESIIKITGISESFFGLILMAFITNVEEFWLMYKSTRKNQLELGISTQIGKILWNFTLIYGISLLMINNYIISLNLIISAVICLIITIYLVIALYRKRLYKRDALVLLAILIIFVAYNFYAEISL